jgi:hypothetical protein
MDKVFCNLEDEIGRLNQRAHQAFTLDSLNIHRFDILLVLSLTPANRLSETKLINLGNEMLINLAKHLGVHLHAFFGTRESADQRPHLHLAIFCDQSAGSISTSKAQEFVKKWWLKYGLLKRQDIGPWRGGNAIGYIVNKNSGIAAHFIDRVFCPRLDDCKPTKNKRQRRCRFKRISQIRE